MKEEINLLPPAAQRARMSRILRKRLAYVGRRLLLALVLVWVVLAAAGWWFVRQEQVLQRKLAGEAERAVSAEKEVREINELMGLIEARVDDHPAWSPQLKDVVNVVPAEARVEVISLSADDKLIVRGISSSPTAVLDMERSLKQLAWVQAVEAPLQNFAAGGKGEFSFTLIRTRDKHEEK